jgi:dienelactone hydrolase
MLGSGIPRGKSFQAQWVIGILLLALFPGSSVAQKSYGTRIASVKRVNSPASNASAFDLGWHYRIDVKRQGEPVLVALNAGIGSLEGVDLNTLKLAYYDDKERRYQIVSNVLPDAKGRFEAPVERSGTYSLIALPSLPFPVQAVAKLCTAPDKPEIRLTKPQLDELCPRVYCPAFKESGLPKPFDGRSTCDRCYDLNGRAPREIAECGLLPFDTTKKIDPKLPAFSCAAFQAVARIRDPSEPGPYMTRSVSYRCGDAGGSLGTAVVPLRPASNRLPFVLYVHGSTSSDDAYKGYDYVLQRLASHGIIAASIPVSFLDYEPTDAPAAVRGRVEKIKSHFDCWRDGQVRILEGGTFSGQFSGRIDTNKIGLAGHSRGGEAIVLAVERNRKEGWGYGIQAIHAIAPTDHFGLAIDGVPYLVLLGAADGDAPVQGLKVFDRATRSKPKIQAFLYGANHGWFNSVLSESWETNMQPPLSSERIPPQTQRQVERVLAVSFFRQFLQGFGPSRDLWTGKARTSSLDTVRLFWSYQDPDSLLVDTFEPTESGRDPFRNDLGGRNESIPGIGPPHPIYGTRISNRLTPFTEASLQHDPFHHETGGLQLGWGSPYAQRYRLPTGRYEIHIPTKYRRTVALKPYLAFRVAQFFDPVENSSGQPQDFEVGLEDANGNQAYVKVSDFAEIPWPYERADGNTKSVLQTVRIPLCTFSNKNNDLKTESIAKILFRFNERATGLLAFDDVQFTK